MRVMFLPIRRVVIAAVVGTLLTPIVVVNPAVGQEDANTFSDEFLAELPVTDDELREVVPNHSWDGLGLFSDDALRVLEVIAEDVVTEPYAFGDDPNGEPVIDPPGADPIRRGAMEWTLPADWVPPAQGVTDTTAFGSIGDLSGVRNVTLMWAQYDGVFDFGSGLTINEGFPIAVPGLPVWNSSFAGDTWEGSNLIPNAEVQGGTVNLVINRFEPPQSFTPVDMGAFYFRAGDIMAIAIDSEALFAFMDEAGTTDTTSAASGETSTLLYTGGDKSGFTQTQNRRLVHGLAGHIARALFTPGRVSRLEARDWVLLTRVASTLLELGVPIPDDVPRGEPLIDDDSLFDEVEADMNEDLDAETGAATTADGEDGSGPLDEGSGDSSRGLLIGGGLVSLLIALVIWATVKRRTAISDRKKARRVAKKRARRSRGPRKKAAVKKAPATKRSPGKRASNTRRPVKKAAVKKARHRRPDGD